MSIDPDASPYVKTGMAARAGRRVGDLVAAQYGDALPGHGEHDQAEDLPDLLPATALRRGGATRARL